MARNKACDIRNVATRCYQCVAGSDFYTVRVENGVATEVESNFEAAKVHPACGRSTAGDLTAQVLACFLVSCNDLTITFSRNDENSRLPMPSERSTCCFLGAKFTKEVSGVG